MTLSQVSLKNSKLSEDLLQETDVLCLFGFSIQQALAEFEPWSLLEGKSLLVFVSEEQGWTPLLDKQSKIVFLFCDSNACDFERFSELCQERVFQTVHYHISCEFQQENNSWVHPTISKCQMIQWQKDLEASDFRDFGVKVLKNVLQNLQKPFDLQSFQAMKGALKGVPAFICGAGPSLKDSLPFLKQTGDRGILFAGGAALGDLSSIPIHISAGVDPDPSLERCQMQGSFEAPFFYQSRFASALVDRMHGPLFQVPSHCNYEIERWIELQEAPQLEAFEGGWTVTSFCASLALHLGCSPLIFVGMDLSYTSDGLKYSSKGEQNLKEEMLYEGHSTQKDWVIAAKWVEHLVENHPKVHFYTISQMGLPLKGVLKCSWEELLDQELLVSYDCIGMVHCIKSMWIARESDLETRAATLKQIQSSFAHSLFLVDQMLSLYQLHYPKDPQNKGEFIVLLFDLYEEVVYQNILKPLWKVWGSLLEKKIENSSARELNQLLFFKKVLQEHTAWEGLCN